MFARNRILRTGFVLGMIAVPIAALASHGKAGLWEVTTHMNMPNMMANIPPEELAKMRAMGVHMPDAQTYTSRQCMTAVQVAEDKPPPMHNAKDCAMTNVMHDGHHFSADMKCSGEMQGTGHTSVTYDSNEHYSGSYSFQGMEEGNPQKMSISFEGKWISADCGSMK